MTRLSAVSIFIIAAASWAGTSQARDHTRDAYFTSNIYLDLPVILLSAGAWTVSAARDYHSDLDSCAPVCDPSTVNSWDRHVVDHRHHGAATASNILVGLLPAQAIGLIALDFARLGGEDGVADLIILIETLSVSGALTQIVKTRVARPRPYMYREDSGDGLRKNNADDYRSFYSMHTAAVFAVLTGAAFIYSWRYADNRLKYLVWALALSSGAIVAALRVAAGNHFYTDVVTGAVAGCAVGLIVPILHLRQRRTRRDVVIRPAGLGVMGTF